MLVLNLMPELYLSLSFLCFLTRLFHYFSHFEVSGQTKCIFGDTEMQPCQVCSVAPVMSVVGAALFLHPQDTADVTLMTGDRSTLDGRPLGHFTWNQPCEVVACAQHGVSLKSSKIPCFESLCCFQNLDGTLFVYELQL